MNDEELYMNPARLADTQRQYGMPEDPLEGVSSATTENAQILQEPMQKALDRVMGEMQERLTRFGEAVKGELGIDLDIQVADSRRSDQGTWTITVEANSRTGKRSAETFQLSWSGDKAPSHIDLMEWGQEAWPPQGYAFLYRGISEVENITRELAIYSHGRQYPGTLFSR